jgi:NADH-quinone oxidoreductase subunit H
MILDIGIVAAKAFLVLFMVLNLAGILGWIERKGSALIQDRIGANRASILGLAGMGLVNTLIADPLKFLTKEDFVPPQGDKFLHTLAPCMALFTALVTFAVIPFGDVLVLGDRVINLQVANLNIGILYIFAIASLGVYGIVIGAWASNNKFSLLGGVRGSAQMISYEVAMGLSVIGILMIFGTLELQEIARGQGTLIRDMLPESASFLKSAIGWLPAWGVFLQPLAFLLFFTAAVAETKRIPFDLPEGESELVAGYHVEYSGGKVWSPRCFSAGGRCPISCATVFTFHGARPSCCRISELYCCRWGRLLSKLSFSAGCKFCCVGACRDFATIR